MDGGASRRTWTSKVALLVLQAVLWMHGCWRRATRGGRRRTGKGNTPRNLNTVGIVLPNSEDVRWQLPWIAKTALWCSSLGVQEIVLHDPMGQLKEHKDALMENVLEQAESLDPIIGCIRCRCSYPSRNGAKTKPVHIRGRNYEEEIFELPMGVTRVELQLHIICETDSYLSLLEAASLPMCKVEQLARNGSGEGAGRTWNATLTAQELDQELRGLQSHLPDPQVVMVLGEDMSLAGYPPWNIQVSEIYCLGPATHVSRKHIARVVQSYFRTMQRFGK